MHFSRPDLSWISPDPVSSYAMRFVDLHSVSLRVFRFLFSDFYLNCPNPNRTSCLNPVKGKNHNCGLLNYYQTYSVKMAENWPWIAKENNLADWLHDWSITHNFFWCYRPSTKNLTNLKNLTVLKERRYAIQNQIYYIVLWDKQQIVVTGNVYICFYTGS